MLAKIFINFFSFIMLVPFLVMAQPPDSVSVKSKYTIKINPLQLAMGETRFILEKSINETQEIQMVISYIGNLWFNDFPLNHLNGNPLENPKRQGGKIGLGNKYYLKKSKGQKSIYFNPLVFYKYLFYTNVFSNTPLNIKIKDATYHIVSLQIQCGKVHSWQRIFIDYYLGIGVRYKYGVATMESKIPEVILSEKRELESWVYPSIHIGFNIGCSFYKSKK